MQTGDGFEWVEGCRYSAEEKKIIELLSMRWANALSSSSVELCREHCQVFLAKWYALFSEKRRGGLADIALFTHLWQMLKKQWAPASDLSFFSPIWLCLFNILVRGVDEGLLLFPGYESAESSELLASSDGDISPSSAEADRVVDADLVIVRSFDVMDMSSFKIKWLELKTIVVDCLQLYFLKENYHAFWLLTNLLSKLGQAGGLLSAVADVPADRYEDVTALLDNYKDLLDRFFRKMVAKTELFRPAVDAKSSGANKRKWNKVAPILRSVNDLLVSPKGLFGWRDHCRYGIIFFRVNLEIHALQLNQQVSPGSRKKRQGQQRRAQRSLQRGAVSGFSSLLVWGKMDDPLAEDIRQGLTTECM